MEEESFQEEEASNLGILSESLSESFSESLSESSQEEPFQERSRSCVLAFWVYGVCVSGIICFTFVYLIVTTVTSIIKMK